MDDEIKAYVYPSSHFLPYIIHEDSLARMKKHQTSSEGQTLVAITAEVIRLGSYRMAWQKENLDRLRYLYQTTILNLEEYAIGFLTPCSLIAMALMMQKEGVEKTITSLHPSNNREMKEDVSRYLAKHLFTAHALFMKSRSGDPTEAAQEIYKLCEENPLIPNK